MNDKPKNQRLRNLLVVALREKGIADKDLLNATLWGWQLYVERSFEQYAHLNKPFTNEAGQTINTHGKRYWWQARNKHACWRAVAEDLLGMKFKVQCLRLKDIRP